MAFRLRKLKQSLETTDDALLSPYLALQRVRVLAWQACFD